VSFKKNIIANYSSQIYSSLAGFLILPLYLKYMGAEAYGLVGFFAMLQVFFNLFDMGLTPSIAREAARLRGGAIEVLSYRKLLRALQLIFFFIALGGAGTVFLLANYLSHSWLKVQLLPIDQVQNALKLMALSVAFRWVSNLYRAVLAGSEQFVWLSCYLIIFTTLRYVGVLLVLMYFGATPTLFFSYQVIIAGIELLILANKVIKMLPALSESEKITWNLFDLWISFKSIFPFALSIAITSAIWILITQTDKLILSKLLSLTDYGYFTLGVLAASGVMTLSVPISTALMPRMARLKAEGNEDKLLQLYCKATQLIATIVIPACIILSLFPEQLLLLWSNNSAAAHAAAPVLRLYALGNGALALSAFPYYLQYAYGNMRLHLIGNTFFVMTLIPSIIWSTWHYGMIGAAWVWLIANIGFFILWTAFIHHHFVKNLHARWFLRDVLPFILISSMILLPLKYYVGSSNDKMGLILQICFFAAISFVFNALYIKLQIQTNMKKLT